MVTVADRVKIAKEVWTASKLEKQFYDKAPVLDRIERTNKNTIGEEFKVPIHKGRSGAASVFGPDGGTLNGPDSQKVDKAAYGISYNYHYIGLQFGAMNQINGTASIGKATTLEMEGGMADIRKQVMRQLAGEGGGLIAECTTTTASTTVHLDPAGLGYDAIVRGHIVEGQAIDIGTVANPVSVVSNRIIEDVIEDAADPRIVISGAAVTTAANDYIAIHGARSANATNEMASLVQIAGSEQPLGGLNPASAGERFWKPAFVDDTTTAISLALLLKLRLKVNQKTGEDAPVNLTSLQQVANVEEILQNQVRFMDPDKLSAGNAMLKWNGYEIWGDPDIYDRHFFTLKLDDLTLGTGEYDKPVWMSDVQGNGGMLWQQGTTQFVDALCYALGIGTSRRNSSAAATNLTA
jgi:hypothetical protein